MLQDAYNTDAPTTKNAATRLAAGVNEAIESLREWLNDLTDAADNVTQAADEIAEADREERDEAHTSLTEALGEVLHELRAAQHPS